MILRVSIFLREGGGGHRSEAERCNGGLGELAACGHKNPLVIEVKQLGKEKRERLSLLEMARFVLLQSRVTQQVQVQEGKNR